MNPKPPRIFRSIVSYDDWDIYQTIASAKANTKDWSRVSGVCVFQTNTNPATCPPIDPRIRLHILPKAWTTGVGRPRNLALKGYTGEEYFFMTDSHMRFRPDWDASFIAMMEEMKKKHRWGPIPITGRGLK